MNNQLRTELTTLPERIAALPIDERGYPVPYFAASINGTPDHRIVELEKFYDAVGRHLCWICGTKLGTHLAFILGPMCVVNRTTAEPHMHKECAVWAVQNCPFLTRPHMRRRENQMPNGVQADPNMLRRNPGVNAIWVTRRFNVFLDRNKRPLLEVEDPEEVTWWAEGRPATREEVEESFCTGLPLLMQVAEEKGPAAVAALRKAAIDAERFFPAAAKVGAHA